MKKHTFGVVFLLILCTYIYPYSVSAKAIVHAKNTKTHTIQNKKNTTAKKTKKKKKTKKHKDKINTTIAPLIDPSNPPGGN
jgi:anionic cell wall polymer biosynthesis LytR-Cps2A-Psr (LCP) family protein